MCNDCQTRLKHCDGAILNKVVIVIVIIKSDGNIKD